MTSYEWIIAHKDYAGKDCLIWPFSRIPTGYGNLGHNCKIYYAHRVMCELVYGPCPAGMECAHSCGNGRGGCVHPDHLEWKTPSENNLDKRKHGTHISSRWGNRSRFSPEDIQKMRDLASEETNLATARRFGCSDETVRYWRSIDRMPLPRHKPKECT